jgi:hypothetical protein
MSINADHLGVKRSCPEPNEPFKETVSKRRCFNDFDETREAETLDFLYRKITPGGNSLSRLVMAKVFNKKKDDLFLSQWEYYINRVKRSQLDVKDEIECLRELVEDNNKEYLSISKQLHSAVNNGCAKPPTPRKKLKIAFREFKHLKRPRNEKVISITPPLLAFLLRKPNVPCGKRSDELKTQPSTNLSADHTL